MSEETYPPSDSQEIPTEAPVFPALEEIAALLPQYEFHDILGIGGMGAVYLARQAALDRWVAIKLLPETASLNAEDASRFIQEARSMARLTHAHIAAVHDFGQTAQGQLYLVMEYVCGHSLHALIHNDALSGEHIRGLVTQLCDALEYAHGHGIVHRDIKPANILVTEDWQTKIIDFGLAHDKDVAAGGGDEYGTPDYVAPERLQTDAQVDHRADIYSLGVVIHEMFTKLTPQGAGGLAKQCMPPEFATVVTRCTAIDPALRYQKCGEIKTFLTTTAVAPPPSSVAVPAPAYKPSLPPHLQAQVRRKLPPSSSSYKEVSGVPGWVWAAAAVVVLGFAGWFVLSPPGKAVPVEQTAAAAAADETKTMTQPAAPPPTPPPAVASDAPPGPFKPGAGNFSVLKRLKGHTELVHASAILPDQRRAVSGGHDDTLKLWDVATGVELKSFPSPVGDIHGLLTAADGRRVLLYSLRSDQVAIFDLEEGKAVATIKAPTDRLASATWTADEKRVYLLCNDTTGGVYHWDPSKGAVLQQFSDWPRAAYHIFPLPAAPPDVAGQLLVIGSTMKENLNSFSNEKLIMDKPWAALFSAADHRLIRELPDYTNIRNRLSLSPDGTTLVGGLGALYLLDVPALTTRATLEGRGEKACSSSTWAAAGRLLVCGYADGSLIIRDVETGEQIESINIGLRSTAVSISKDESWAVVSGFPLDIKNPQPAEFEVVVVRLPDLTKTGSFKGFLAMATRQLPKLKGLDPQLASIREQMAAPGTLMDEQKMRAEVQAIASKYGDALKRSAATAPAAEKAAMNAEADAIARGEPVPEPASDATALGEHKRLRDVYRQQIAQLDLRRLQAAAALRRRFELPLRDMSHIRNQAGDRLGSARCEAVLAMLREMSPTLNVPVAAASGPGGTRPATAPVAETPIKGSPGAPSSSSPPGMASLFGSEVKIEVTIGRPSKIKGGDFDDKMQVIEPHVKMTNTSLKQSYDGYKACFLLIGESAADSKVIQVMQREEFPISLPSRLFLQKDLPSVTTQYDTTGAKFGFKYEGWLVQVTGPGGDIVHTKSTFPSLEKMPEKIQQMKAGAFYDRKLQVTTDPDRIP